MMMNLMIMNNRIMIKTKIFKMINPMILQKINKKISLILKIMKNKIKIKRIKLKKNNLNL